MCYLFFSVFSHWTLGIDVLICVLGLIEREVLLANDQLGDDQHSKSSGYRDPKSSTQAAQPRVCFE